MTALQVHELQTLACVCLSVCLCMCATMAQEVYGSLWKAMEGYGSQRTACL